MRRFNVILAVALATTFFSASDAGAQWIRNGRLDSPMVRSDDSYATRSLGFNINYFGNVVSEAIVCTNGYAIVSGLAPGGLTCAFPSQFGAGVPVASQLSDFYGAVMAPYFTDVRTDFAAPGNQGGQIFTSTSSINGILAWSATWDAVRGYAFGATAATQRVSFQLVLAQLSATAFLMEFNYGALAWDAEGGVGFSHDGSWTGTPEAYSLAATRQAREFSRFSCSFDRGSLSTCSTNQDVLATLPEPSSVALLATGLVGVLVMVRRRRQA